MHPAFFSEKEFQFNRLGTGYLVFAGLGGRIVWQGKFELTLIGHRRRGGIGAKDVAAKADP